MRSDTAFPAMRPLPTVLIVAVALGVAVLVAIMADARALALGGLAAWLFCLSVTVGASVWLLIGALTGGRWLEAAAPVLAPLSKATWIFALMGAAFILAAPVLYPWWTDGTGARQALWLDPALFGLRTAGVLALWSLMGLLATRGVTPLIAALLLCAHGLGVSIAGLDWLLSLDPAFGSTAFGAHLAVLQLGLALALVAVTGRIGQRGDIGGLLLACVLGIFYLAAMEYLVRWAGNLPPKAAWYLARQDGIGLVLLWLSFGLGVLGPFAVLLSTRARRSVIALRWSGVAMLAGGGCHLVWLVAPDRFAASPIAVALVVAAGAAALLIWGRRA